MSAPTREGLINLLLKYRGAKPVYCINKYKKEGLRYVQELFDAELSTRIHHENKIKVPHKIILYEELNLTRKITIK